MNNATQHGKNKRIGLLAAWGDYPIEVARALRKSGHTIYCLGVEGHANRPALEPLCSAYESVGIGRLGFALRYFKKHAVQNATMAGKFHKTLLYRPWVWFRHLPDWTAIRHFFPYFAQPQWSSDHKDCKDDTLLLALVDAFARRDIHFVPATDYAPELLVQCGQLTKRGLTLAQENDIAFGWDLAKEMGRLDVGQSVAVKGQAVLAVEAIEGTDQCIRRAGSLCPSGEFTVVKVAKPNQDMRFDVPTIGLGTVRSLHEAGGRVLAIEAKKTIVVGEDELIAYADQHKLVIVSFSRPEAESIAA
ncbi:MAG: hypothetical protein CMJ74_08150 [Planctomycetaceae bacterium]|nr:hypothetical protein [Planctomycetaceae bacterium]